MANQYVLRPKFKNLTEIRGIEGISLLFPDQHLLEKIEIEKVLINCLTKDVTLYLKAPDDLDNKLRAGIERSVSEFLQAKCKTKLVKENVKPEKDEEPKLGLEQLEETIKKRFPGIYAWLTSTPLTLAAEGTLVVNINSSLALDYIRPRERQLAACLHELTGTNFRLIYEVVEEEGPAPVLPEEVSFPEETHQPVVTPSPAITNPDQVLLGSKIREEACQMKDLPVAEDKVVIEGEVIKVEVRTLKSGRNLLLFDLTDYSDSLSVKAFATKKCDPSTTVQKGMWLRVKGNLQYDDYAKEIILMAQSIQMAVAPELRDEAAEKRIELHLHTKMSAMDSLVDLEKAIKMAAGWGHQAIAITDHGVVQAFPEAARLGKKYGIKIIYGMEGYLVNDQEPIVTAPPDCSFSALPLVVVDIETTGLNPKRAELLEIGAVKVDKGEVTAVFSEFVRPQGPIPYKISQLTGITEEMVKNASLPADVLGRFKEFAAGAIFVAHNARFDLGFLQEKFKKHLKEEFAPPIVDTLALSRALWPEWKSHRLNAVAKGLGIIQEHHHRAGDDALTAWKILKRGLEGCQERSLEQWSDLNALVTEVHPESLHPYHLLLLVKDQTGLENLYRLVSESHLKYFHRHPRIPRSLLTKYRKGLLLGSACEAGELFSALLDGVEAQKAESIAEFYDFLEIQPLTNNEFLVREGRLTKEELVAVNRRICRLGEQQGKPVVATGDVHFLRPEDAILRRILLAGQGYADAEEQPLLHLRTTKEMLAEFSYLGEDWAQQVVVDNPKRMAAEIGEIKPVPDQFYPPKLPGAEEEIRTATYRRAEELYGNPLPQLIAERLEVELKSIIGHGYAVLYLIAQKLVKKSLDDGYLVGSRGSVGSSLVATMCGITEVNPLPAHYRCAQCHYSEFMETGAVGSGFDLPDKKCPQCGAPLVKDGQDIQFATFMGFEGDKEPDIDLNFSGEYQPTVHRYTEELLGKGYVFRAGTITGLAEKTAYGFVRGYLGEKGASLRQAEINRLVQGCTGVRRSTGQHPGGMIVLPQDQEIYKFTPIQYPANDRKAEWVTTHFDYHAALEGRLVKLDILGHDDPTVIRMLYDLTGVDPLTIPLDEARTMKLFSSVEPLGLSPEELGFDLGTLGIPELGTGFVRQMLEDTKPQTFSELICISGLSHGTNVWLGNAQELIKAQKATLLEVISTRDKIMNDLIFRGVPPKQAFAIMEKVRKGRNLDAEDIQILKEKHIPQWYIDSCLKIKYLFPKAHAAAYVMMGFRIAYYKIYYPEAFYASYFTVRADEFNAELVIQGEEFIKNYLKELDAKGNELTAREKSLYAILEVVFEAMLRKIKFLPIDLYQSDATKFLITTVGLLMPLVSIPGLGEAAARAVVTARAEGEFVSVEDLKNRAHLSSSVIEVLTKQGCLAGLPATNQLTLF